MSLLNEMLRNLDNRGQPPDPGGDIQVSRQGTGQLKRLSGWLIVLLLAAALGTGIVLDHYHLLDQAPLAVLEIPVPPEASVAVDRVPVQSTSGAEADSMEFDSPTPGTADPEEPGTGQEQLPIEPALADNQPGQVAAIPTSGPHAEPEATPADQGTRSILRQPADFYTVQLMAMKDEGRVLKYARENGLTDPLYALIQNQGLRWYVLLLGIYPDNLMATRAMDEWASSRKLSAKPWIRRLGSLQEAIVLESAPIALADGDQKDFDEQEIQQLLLDARLALLLERLTSPPEDNAYDRFRRVLELIPQHPIALAGMEQIVSTYLVLAREYLASGDVEHARQLIERAQQVDGKNSAVATIAKQLRATGQLENTPGTTVSPVIDESTVEADVSRTNIKDSSAMRRREESLLNDVENLLLRGHEAEARDLLEQFLVDHPNSAATIETLFRLYLQQDNFDMAARLLGHSTQLPSSTATKLGAQLRAEQGDIINAVKMLEKGANGKQDASYYAYLASLYQKMGRYREAADYYRRLLRNEPDQAAYWLGLAVSLDSLKDYQEALVAFLRTREYGHYDGEVQRYIDQRISALSR